MANNSAGQHTQSIRALGRAALQPKNGALLGIGPARFCSIACALVARASYLALHERVAVCAPTPDAVLVQAKMWYDADINDDDWIIFDEDDFFLWAWPDHDARMHEHTYSVKLKRFAKQWAKDDSHEQHDNAKAYLAGLLVEDNNVDPKSVDRNKEQDPVPEQEALEGHFWGKLRVVFCINIGAGHDIPKSKFEPDVLIMDQAGRATFANAIVPISAWKESIKRLIQAGDIRQPNPDRPVIQSHGMNEAAELFKKSLLEERAGTPEKFYKDSNYTVVVLHDE